VTELFPTRDGALWVMANDHLWKLKNDQWILDAGAWPARQPPLTKLIEDRSGSVWFSHFGGGLVRLDRDGHILTLSARDGLPGDRVRCFFQDREGNFWVGIDRGGLVRLREKQFQVLGTSDGLSDPVVLGVCEDAEGAIWAGTYGGGLNRWADGKFTVFNLGPEELKGYVFTVFPDRDKRLWIGTRDNGVFIRENGEFRHPFPTNAIPAPVRAIFQDRAGNVWLGSGAGVFRWHAGQLEHFAADTELANADVRAFAEDAEGGLWIGTQGNGLHRFKAGRHLVLHAADGLPNEFVRSLFTDREGTLWIGLYDSALFRWKDGRLARAVSTKDLPGDVISDFQEDERGRLWFSTGLGLIRMAKADLNAFADGRENRVPFVAYGMFDGLPTVDFSGGVQPAGWHARDGRLWFTTSKGLISFLPAAVTVNSLPPPVVVESLLVDGELFASSTDKGKEVQDLRQELRVPAGRTQFEFRFTGLSFTAPDKVRFQYRLAGLQSDWKDAGVNRFVTYNYLPPGQYKFQVRAANNDGVWNDAGATVTFELRPHFWQQWWFSAAAILLIIGLVWLAYYIRMARLRELERLRLRIARDLHDDVGANLASMALIAEAMEKQPEFGDPADLKHIALNTIDALRDIVWFIDPARDRLGDLVTRMRDTAPLLLTGMKYDFEVNMPNPEINLPPAFRRNVFPIFKEALHNAASHARASQVGITLDCRDGVLRLKVKDDGIGFDEQKIIPGNGLRNLRRRAAEMHGAVRIQTAPGQGTTVEFEAPFPRTRGFYFKSNPLK
jgi:signal transduction histidine kinase/streptogramin lyase